MITGIEVRRHESDLCERVWRFWLDDSRGRLVLDTYQVLQRPTKRHGWKVTDSYRRIDTRGGTLNIDNVPWSEDIEREALAALFARIHVVKN